MGNPTFEPKSVNNLEQDKKYNPENPLTWPKLQVLRDNKGRFARKLIMREIVVKEDDLNYIDDMADEFNTARHEIKHKIVAKESGADVHKVTIIPNGYKGATFLTVKDMEDFVAISLASSIEDNLDLPYDRSGRGSDLSQAASFSARTSRHKYGGRVSAGSIHSAGYNFAQSVISRVNAGEMEDRCFALMVNKVE